MSIPLIDFRCKVTLEADAVLEAAHDSTGVDKSEIARGVLHEWALLEIKKQMVLRSKLKSKGILREYEGE